MKILVAIHRLSSWLQMFDCWPVRVSSSVIGGQYSSYLAGHAAPFEVGHPWQSGSVSC